jgi:hypothetical protein
VGKRQLLTVQPASAGDRVAYSRRLFMSPLPGFVSCTASSSHGYGHGPHSAAATRLASARFTSAWCALASRMRARGFEDESRGPAQQVRRGGGDIVLPCRHLVGRSAADTKNGAHTYKTTCPPPADPRNRSAERLLLPPPHKR